MKKSPTLISVIALAILPPLLSSCTTTYDAYGRPVQSVDPGAAAAGAVAAGALGYAIGRNNDDDHRHYYHGRSYRRPHYHHGRRGFRW